MDPWRRTQAQKQTPQKELTNMKLNTNPFQFPATRVANVALNAGLLALVGLALTPRTLRAQDLSLDNFATGAGKISATTGTHEATQTGSGIIGGNRNITLASPSGANEFQQPIQVQVLPSTTSSVPSAFLWDVGYGAIARIDMIYGNTTSLGLNLTAYNRFRISFNGLSSTLNFNIVVWQSNNVASSNACNLLVDEEPFTVDMYLAGFPNTGAPAMWENIEAIDIVFQGGGINGSPNLAITGFSAVPASVAPGTVTCGATT
jgi:hypothetical protein